MCSRNAGGRTVTRPRSSRPLHAGLPFMAGIYHSASRGARSRFFGSPMRDPKFWSLYLPDRLAAQASCSNGPSLRTLRVIAGLGELIGRPRGRAERGRGDSNRLCSSARCPTWLDRRAPGALTAAAPGRHSPTLFAPRRAKVGKTWRAPLRHAFPYRRAIIMAQRLCAMARHRNPAMAHAGLGVSTSNRSRATSRSSAAPRDKPVG